MPDDADFAAVFFEPGKIDALGGAAQIRFGNRREDRRGDAEAHQLGRLSEIGAEVRDEEGLFAVAFLPRQNLHMLIELKITSS